jgi:hypothetical protein
MKRIKTAMPMKVAPSGLPTWRSLVRGDSERLLGFVDLAMVVLRRKSCVMAMPMLAKEREVRSQARKVRSVYVSRAHIK